MGEQKTQQWWTWHCPQKWPTWIPPGMDIVQEGKAQKCSSLGDERINWDSILKIAWNSKNGGNPAWPRSWEWGKRRGKDGCKMSQSGASASPCLLHSTSVSSCTSGQGSATLAPALLCPWGVAHSMKWLWQGSRCHVLNPECSQELCPRWDPNIRAHMSCGWVPAVRAAPPGVPLL